jgi:hypothetical protein
LVASVSVFFILKTGDTLKFYDEIDYFKIVNNIVDKQIYSIDGLNLTAYRPPVYPLILSFVFKFSRSVIVLKFINLLFILLSAFLVYRIILHFESQSGGLLGSLLVLCYPVLLYATSILYPQTIGAGFFLIFLLLFFQGESSCPRLILASITLGVLILKITSFISILPIVGGYIFLVYPRRRRWHSLAYILFIPMLIVSFWTLRNYRTFHAFIPISTNTGINLLIGNSEHTQVNSGGNMDLLTYYEEVSKYKMNELEQDRFFRSTALKWMSQNKFRAFKLYVLKFLNHFHYRNRISVTAEYMRFTDIIMFLTYYPLLLIPLLRVFVFRKIKLENWEILLLVLYFWFGLVNAVFFTRIRFRLPFDYLLIILTGSFLSKLLVCCSKKKDEEMYAS